MTDARGAIWLLGAPVRWALVGLIRVYQHTLAGVMGGQCRFEPSCSRYGAQAIATRGALVGTGLTIWRVLRCNPYGKGGLDPVPPRAGYDGDTQSAPSAREPAAGVAR